MEGKIEEVLRKLWVADRNLTVLLKVLPTLFWNVFVSVPAFFMQSTLTTDVPIDLA